MNTITVILIICLILVLFALLNKSAKKVENYKKKYPDVIPDVIEKSLYLDKKCSMAGKGVCPYEVGDGFCNLDGNCVNKININFNL